MWISKILVGGPDSFGMPPIGELIRTRFDEEVTGPLFSRAELNNIRVWQIEHIPGPCECVYGLINHPTSSGVSQPRGRTKLEVCQRIVVF